MNKESSTLKSELVLRSEPLNVGLNNTMVHGFGVSYKYNYVCQILNPHNSNSGYRTSKAGDVTMIWPAPGALTTLGMNT